MKNKIFITIIITFFLAASFIVLPYKEAIGFEMESTNYRIWQSSLNVGGGEEQISPNYRLRETIVVMSPAIGGVAGGISNGSSTWTVLTDSPSGYSLSIRANASPALTDGVGNSFSDYTPATADPDFTWSVPATTSEFGYTVEGADTAPLFLDNGIACNTGTANAPDKCWFNTFTTNQMIANSSSANHPAGTQTTVKFRTESGNQHIQPAGTYTAVITATAVAN